MVVIGLLALGSSGSAFAAPTTTVHVAVGTTLVVSNDELGSNVPVTVVRPGIAVFDGNVTTGVRPLIWDSQAGYGFSSQVDQVLKEVERQPAGRMLIDAFGNAEPLDGGRPTSTVRWVDSSGVPTDINIVIGRGLKSGAIPASGIAAGNQFGTVAAMRLNLSQVKVYALSDGNVAFLSPDITLFHELLHAFHDVGGSRTDGVTPVTEKNPANGAEETRAVKTEELQTHGGLAGLAAANGSSTAPDGTVTIGPSRAAENSLLQATETYQQLTADGATPGQLARVQSTIESRTSVAPLTERTYVLEKGWRFRERYAIADLSAALPVPDTDEIGDFLASIRDNPNVLLHEESDDSSDSDSDSDGLAVPCSGDVDGDECDPESRPATDDEAATAERLQSDLSEHAPVVESPAEAVVAEMSPAELAVYARARVAGVQADLTEAAGIDDPVVATDYLKAVGFTSSLADADSSGRVFVPGDVASELADGWHGGSGFGAVAGGVGAVLWLQALMHGVSADSSTLDQFTFTLALVPVVGQILGIADSVINHDPAAIVSNVTALLSCALEFVEAPALAVVFGVASLVAAVVDIYQHQSSDPDFYDYTPPDIAARRDQAWHDQITQGLTDHTIPDLVSAAGAAFQAAQRRILYTSDLDQATIDARVAGQSSEAITQAIADKQTIRSTAAESLVTLRQGFISGPEGIDHAIQTTVTQLNQGQGYGDFTHSYLANTERPRFIKTMIQGCLDGDNDYGLIADQALTLACADRGPAFGDEFDQLASQIQTTTPGNPIDAATITSLITPEITRENAFTLLAPTDTNPDLTPPPATPTKTTAPTNQNQTIRAPSIQTIIGTTLTQTRTLPPPIQW
jgi:hypothetical protein